MIEVILHGQLGNWLFQYAAGRRLALIHRTELHLNLCERFKLRHQGVRWVSSVLERLPLCANLTVRPPVRWLCKEWLGMGTPGSRYYIEPRYGYNADVLELPDGKSLSGYFQSERYFREIAGIIRKELTLPASSDAGVLSMEERITGVDAVSIHVRRTDYVALGWSLLDVSYYRQAMDYFRERLARPHFFVFSDDLDWCRTHLSAADCAFVDLAPARSDPTVDLRLMAMCRHHIIANSSYSWWGAWLNPTPDKIVLAPSVWFPHLAKDLQFLDEILCPEWIRFGSFA